MPIHKKGDRKNISNYRPISLLSCFSKLLKKVVHSRLCNFLDKRKYLFDHQCGFSEKHSTESAANYLVNRITSAMESKDLTLGTFLDLSKAFDTIDHNILLTKLHHNGIRGTAHSWFKSYLTNCKQYTANGRCLSSPAEIYWGVPQGSILGPILFLIYVNDFSKCLQTANAIMYADDTNVFLHPKSVNTLFDKAQLELYNITKWLVANILTININKTKYMCFNSNKNNNLLAYGNKCLSIYNTPLEQVKIYILFRTVSRRKSFM